MQQEREGRSDSNHFGSSPFDSFGAQRSIFGGRDPFDDPFFTRPFGSLFDSSAPIGYAGQSSQPLIQELDSDYESEADEEQEETTNDTTQDKYAQSRKLSKEPLIEHPDDLDNEVKNKDLQLRTNYNPTAEMKPRYKNVSFRKVTYGGINGTFYTATTTRRTAGDGVVLEESKQADTRTGEAAHRISKGIHDKGHTLTRKLDADGRVDTMQTLHNLNEDELANFEQDWKGNVERNLPRLGYEASSSGSPGSSGSGGWGFPVLGRGRMRHESEATPNSFESKPKKIVRINID
jgi:myeloid leukemia factor 1